MRDYATISAKFWIGDTGRKLRGDGDAQRLCFYLMTCPSSTMIGLYYLPIPTLCHELGITKEGASKALRRVTEVGFASYDHETEWVWVHEMARHQVGESLAHNDNRVKSVNKMFSECTKCKFARDFYSRYGECFHLDPALLPPENTCSHEAPSKPLRSQRTGTENREQEINADSSEPEIPAQEPTTVKLDHNSNRPRQDQFPEPPGETVMAFECIGAGNKVWYLVQPQIDAWQVDYPSLDVAQEMRMALNWVKANQRNRKTANGMYSFLVAWLNRAVKNNRGGDYGSKQAGLFDRSKPDDSTRVRTGKVGSAIEQAFAKALAERGQSD